jgi:hypothetical protein
VRVFRFATFLLTLFTAASVAQSATTPSITVTIPAASFPKGATALTGHLIVVFSKHNDAGSEPRDQVQEQYNSAQAFGIDVEGLKPGGALTVNSETEGYPLRRLNEVKSGSYFIQAVFNIYEAFHLSNGKTVWLPPDKGEGQHWNRKPGNPYDAPEKIEWPANSAAKLTLDKVIPPVLGPDELLARDAGAKQYLRFVHMRSAKLSAFWGRDMFLNAWVLLPPGFEEHPLAHYPLVVYQDHFNPSFGLAFRSMPPSAELSGRERTRAEQGYQFFQDWTSGRMPHMLVVSIENANPYYDDSYVMDSPNVGPYGSAVTEEMIPEVERQFRGIGQGWARATFGGSTGGWEALASQLFYPEFYNGTWAACPDPVDFHAYQNVDLYKDKNAFTRQGDFGSIPIAADRQADGSILATTGDEVQFEYVLGTHGRSGEQWNIWQAVFSPQGEDGYPAPVWNEKTGEIDKRVVQYWHDHWDLTAVLERDWGTLGTKLEGKIHVQAGEGDTYFLNNAVHRMQHVLDATRNPHSDASFQYGIGDPHCYTGGPDAYTMQENNRNWAQRVLPQMAAHIKSSAPKGADLSSWVY